MNKNRLIIVDDETDMRNGLQRLLGREFPDLQIIALPDAEQAIRYCAKNAVDLALLDIKMTRMNGLDLLNHLISKDPWLTAIIMTGFGSIETAVQAIKLGAYDFITKPFDKELICRTLNKAIERSRLMRENNTLKEQVCDKTNINDFIGQSPAFQRFQKNLETIARSNYTVLVRGEWGQAKN